VTASPRTRLALVVATLGLAAAACGSAAPGGTGASAGTSGGGSSGNAGSGGSPGGGGSTASAGSGGGGSSGNAGSGGSPGGAGAGGSTGSAGSTAGAGGASAPDGGVTSDGGTVGDGAPGTAALTQFLRIIQVTTVQGTTTVSISIDGTKNHTGAIHAGQALMMRIHVRPDTGWVAHPTVAELHLVSASFDVILTSAPRTITGASTAGNLESTFNFDVTAEQVTKDLKFNVALRDPTGTPETPPPAIQRALYPRTGALDTLDAI
jgi:hypothetical protein